jgi:hypothetical protein
MNGQTFRRLVFLHMTHRWAVMRQSMDFTGRRVDRCGLNVLDSGAEEG